MKAMKKAEGFTLIELMIVVAIIGILSAIAFPSYTNYIDEGKIRTAQADLIALNAAIENNYQKTLSYPDDVADNLANTSAIQGEFANWQPASDDFSFSIDYTVSVFTLKATGTVGRTVGCVLTITQGNVRTLGATAPATCIVEGSEWL